MRSTITDFDARKGPNKDRAAISHSRAGASGPGVGGRLARRCGPDIYSGSSLAPGGFVTPNVTPELRRQAGRLQKCQVLLVWRGGREAEGGGLLNRYTV
jgi:hypothetical protein